MIEVFRILVIDDSEDDRFLYRRALQTGVEAEYHLVETDNGEDGLALASVEQPACILLDYSLPGRNGIEILKRIRSRHAFMPVVMLTGQGNEIIAVDAMREGAQNYITKASITPETLQRCIRVAIEHCNLQKRIHDQRASLELFTRALAHDLKEPVRTIRSFLDIIAKQDLPPRRSKQYFAYIMRAAERMSALIDTVYLYMRLENAPRPSEAEASDAAQALAAAQENLNTLIGERKAVITADAMPRVPANSAQLTQVLQNLLSNAIRHCGTEPVIHVSACCEGDFWIFKVADNGPGIAVENREKIFEPFKRLAGHTEDGLGLGLAICKKIVENAGGRIWCESVLPHGTAFCFTLPDGKAGNAMPVMEAPPANDDANVLAGVLIVEDSEADVELMRLALLEEQKMRCNLVVARNGQEALAYLGHKTSAGAPIDLMIVDINMPGMDGFELLSAMRADAALRSIPVVVCTTSTYDKDIEQSKKLGAVGYLVKPLDFSKLKPILDNQTGLHLRKQGQGCQLLRNGHC